MYGAGISKAIDILTSSAPRIPSIREETARWREKRAERRAREEAQRLRESRALPTQPKTNLSFAPTPFLEPEWILDEIAHAWDASERSTASRNISELRSVRVADLDAMILAANIQPGSHLRGTAVETNKHQLAFPVVIPQRCPGSPRDGVVDVYAPVLESCHMGQNAFRRFREGLEAAMEASTFAKAFTEREIFKQGIFRSDPVSMGRPDRFDLTLRRSMVDQYLDEANRIVFQPKGLVACLFYVPSVTEKTGLSTCEVDLSEIRSERALVCYNGELDDHLWEELEKADQRAIEIETASLIFTGLERAAVQACHGNIEELSRLRATYSDHTKTLDDYFERRLQAAGVRTTSKGTVRKQLFESVDARPQSFKSESSTRPLRSQVLYLVTLSSNGDET